MPSTLDILDKLIAFDTVCTTSNLDLVTYVEDFLKTRGFEVHRIADPGGEQAGLYAEKGPKGEGVLLSAHTDVVPVEGQHWTKDPFRLTCDGDRFYGRGTTDMKGYVASVLAMADRAANVALREPIKIALSYDEEIGCVGLQRMLDRLAPMLGQPKACFVGEPTEMQVAIGHKGKAALRAVCHGQSGHSALAPKFVNALHLANDFLSELRTLQDFYATNANSDSAYSVPYTTFHVGMMTGGHALNIIPDTAELTFEYRHLASDLGQVILTRIQEAAAKVSARYKPLYSGACIEVEQYNSYPGLDVAGTDSIVSYAQSLAQNHSVTKVAFGTEAGFFSELGIPTVVCGPGSMEGQGHKPDEYIERTQLNACDAMMDRILQDLSR